MQFIPSVPGCWAKPGDTQSDLLPSVSWGEHVSPLIPDLPLVHANGCYSQVFIRLHSINEMLWSEFQSARPKVAENGAVITACSHTTLLLFKKYCFSNWTKLLKPGCASVHVGVKKKVSGLLLLYLGPKSESIWGLAPLPLTLDIWRWCFPLQPWVFLDPPVTLGRPKSLHFTDRFSMNVGLI